MSHDVPAGERSFAINQLNWDERVESHMTSSFYDVDGFRRGRDTLGPIESAEIGEVCGKRIAHLQCHFGLDTLSLARRGARMTGLDFSGEAIKAARRLAKEAGIDATFVQGNVYDAPDLLKRGQWDLVYTTWGTIAWLPDVSAWARVVVELLAPGGRLYFLDSQPVASALHQVDPTAPVEPTYDYFHGPVPLEFEDEGSYAVEESRFNHARTHEWIHPLGAMLTALLETGMRLTAVREHDCIAWQLYPSMICGSDGMWRLPPGGPRIPLAVTVEGQKPAH